jgi:hypothetical protein
MIVSTYQPFFCPFPGFFYKAHLSDIFVILDTVQFPRGTTWLTRNRFKNDQGTLWLTIPVWKKGLGLQKIHDVRICRERHWAKKHLLSIKSAYAKAPYLEDHLDFIEGIFASHVDKLVDLNLYIIRYIMKYLRIHTPITLLSELGIEGKGTPLIVEVCKKTGADHFLAQPSTKKYLEAEPFSDSNIMLQFVNSPSLVYPQLWGAFIPHLSILDMILNCGPKTRDIVIKKKA